MGVIIAPAKRQFSSQHTHPFMLIRSKLFVPGSRPELFEKAMNSATDAVSFDLEDAVAPGKKEAARGSVISFLKTWVGGIAKVVIVRVNALSTTWFAQDIAGPVGPGGDIFNLPKVESASDMRLAAEAISRAEDICALGKKIRIPVNIETPKGVRLAAQIATADQRGIRSQLGFADLFLTLGIDRRDEDAGQFVRVEVRLAAGEAGITAYDAAFPDVRNPELCRAEAEAARRLGYAGKSCIHPSQIAIANEVFAPRGKEIEYAGKVLNAAREASRRVIQAFVVDGQLIDAPMIENARAIAAAAHAREPDAL